MNALREPQGDNAVQPRQQWQVVTRLVFAKADAGVEPDAVARHTGPDRQFRALRQEIGNL